MIRSALSVTGWMIRDTFRQSRANGLFWIMLGTSAVFIAVCLSAGVTDKTALRTGVDTPEFLPRDDPQAKKSDLPAVSGQLTLVFGAFRVPLDRDAPTAVRYLQLLLAGGVADTVGIVLALIFTAGFLPRFLESNSIVILLAKPVPRWGLLLGKYVSVLTFIGVQASIFVGGTWFALGVSTGIWDARYLLCVPMLLLHFSIFYSMSVFLAVATRSTMACVFGSVCFWLLCWGMNYGRHFLVLSPEADRISGFLQWSTEIGYWLLPKPTDLGALLFDALDAGKFFAQPFDASLLRAKAAFHPLLSVTASVAFGLLMLAAACREFAVRDW